MTLADAAKLLEISADATPEQIEARFLELRTKLEDKIAKAPTPGLKAKYRESLEEITKAFETLTLAADSSALPVLRREKGEGSREKEDRGQTADGSLPRRSLGEGGRTEDGSQPVLRRLGEGGRSEVRGQRTEDGGPGERTATAKRKSGSREFVIVAAIAVIVLGAGGWWVMRIRAENAEKARIAAERKAEADRAAAEAQAAAVAENQRLQSERALVRGRLAELNARLDATLATERRIEGQLQSVRSDLDSERRAVVGDPSVRILMLQARVAALEKQLDDFRVLLSGHPARMARRRAEAMLGGKDLAEAEGALADYAGQIDALERAVTASAPDLEALDRQTVAAAEILVRWRQLAAKDELARHIVRVFGAKPVGIPADEAGAVEWLRDLARRGDASAMYHVGLLQVQGRLTGAPDPYFPTGDRWIRKAAELGLPEAAVWLGRDFNHPVLSISHFKRAAEAGNADGEYEYGKALLTGWGVSADPVAAVPWLERAARQGHGPAQYLLGRLYEQGRGVLANATTAYDWLRQAARQGEEEARAYLRTRGRDW